MSYLYVLGAIFGFYFLIGFILGFIWFAIAKVLEFDNRNPYWNLILNTVMGFLYFQIVVCIFWLPALVPLLRKWKNQINHHKEKIPDNPRASWKHILLRPIHSLKEIFLNWYYIQ
ncbi:hypothetical protein AWU65_03645 [Paenibacillus glucanolyticus]|jgi:hypothetical protein|uniref:Uncharacterized protein n=1 Tax=Paenibacillus glucanolyticus TaxID=59843 RepID=A0A163GQ07_9BACL|nr:hypothetical protein AWU65_03645 [Paenibacillus glucanolyticus]OMF65494.1 hypothetical protein BK142_30850 [Paenibacillus glucanolyticus]